MKLNIPIPLILTLLASPISACTPDEHDRALLIGTWSDHQTTVPAGDSKPQMEFMKHGRFRSRNQVGEVLQGTWKWTSPATVRIRFAPNDETINVEVRSLTSDVLVLHGSKPAKYRRLEAWHPAAPSKKEN